MKEKLTKNKVTRKVRKLRVFGLVASVLTIASIASFVPLIELVQTENAQIEMNIDKINDDINNLNNQLKQNSN